MSKNKLIFAMLLLTVFSSQAFAAEDAWAVKSAMPTERHSLHAASAGGLLYVAGGHDGSSGAVNSVEVYDPAADAWVTSAPMPSPVYEGAAGVIDGKLYVAGGWDFPVSGIPTRILQIYDPASNTWSRGADMPILSACSVAGAVNRKLYVLTACDGYSGFRKYLHVYDPESNSWTEKSPPPGVHAYAAGGVIDGKFYVTGGFDGSNVIAALNVYDPAADTWVTRASMPTSRRSLAAGVVDGKLYAFGGNDGKDTLATLEVYDPATDTWTAKASMPTARSALAAAVIAGKLYAIGGNDGAKALAALEVFPGVTPTPTATAAPTATATAVPAVTTAASPPVITTPAPAKFRVGPTVRLRPVTDMIEADQDGIVELYMDNPSLNDVTLKAEARVSVPSGIHVYGQGFAQAGAAGMVMGTFEIPPGTARTIAIVIKADKSARIGSHTIQLIGLYYPGENKDRYQPISLTFPLKVREASKRPDDPQPSQEVKGAETPSAAGFGIVLAIGIFGIIRLLRGNR